MRVAHRWRVDGGQLMGARGEAELETDSRTVRLLYTNRALAEVEAAMDKSILAVLVGFKAGDSGISDLGLLLRAGMEAARRDAREGGRPVSLTEAYNVLDEVGFSAAAAAVFGSIAEVLSYDREADDSPNP